MQLSAALYIYINKKKSLLNFQAELCPCLDLESPLRDLHVELDWI
jgi:hypothetical protein